MDPLISRSDAQLVKATQTNADATADATLGYTMRFTVLSLRTKWCQMAATKCSPMT